MARHLRDQSLAIFFGVIFLLAVVGQAIAGHSDYNQEQLAHHGEVISFGRYITSSAFGAAVMENWQSEYLQFTLFVLGTVWLVQRGSPESKRPGKEGTESDREQKIGQHASPRSPRWARVGGLRTAIYSNSLLIVMTLIFFGSWFAHSVTGWSEYNSEQAQHGEPKLSWIGFIGSSRFWEQTLQNWQSEFLAVGSFARALDLPPPARVAGVEAGRAPHEATGDQG